MYLTAPEIEILKGENEVQDFKHEVSSSIKIAKTLVAFANTKGGKLWIGVKDNGKIVGCEIDEERFMIEQACHNYCKPVLNVTFHKHKIVDKMILEVRIPYSAADTYYSKDEQGRYWAYVRALDHTILAGIVTLEVFLKRKNTVIIKYTDIERNILKFLHDFGKKNLVDIVGSLKIRRKIIIGVLAKLVMAKVVAIVYENNIEFFEVIPIV